MGVGVADVNWGGGWKPSDMKHDGGSLEHQQEVVQTFILESFLFCFVLFCFLAMSWETGRQLG